MIDRSSELPNLEKNGRSLLERLYKSARTIYNFTENATSHRRFVGIVRNLKSKYITSWGTPMIDRSSKHPNLKNRGRLSLERLYK